MSKTYLLQDWQVLERFTLRPVVLDENGRPTTKAVILYGKCPERAKEVSRTGDETHPVFTSRVVRLGWEPLEGSEFTMVVETVSGTRYRLGAPSEVLTMRLAVGTLAPAQYNPGMYVEACVFGCAS